MSKREAESDFLLTLYMIITWGLTDLMAPTPSTYILNTFFTYIWSDKPPEQRISKHRRRLFGREVLGKLRFPPVVIKP